MRAEQWSRVVVRGAGLGAALVAALLVLAAPAAAGEKPAVAGDQTAAASAPAVAGQQTTRDPLQGFNRKVFVFNDHLDRWILKPVAKGYDRVTPEPVQRRIGNFFDNLRTPFSALNQLLQGKPKAGLEDIGRFAFNSTFGVAGLFDFAAAHGLPPPRFEEDFGQTFAVWSGGQGTFVMIPFRGPATTTHGAGMILNLLTSPLRLLPSNEARYAVGALQTVDTRAQLLSAENLISSGDRYLFMRDAYLQSRQYEIDDGQLEEDPFLNDGF